MTDQHSNHDYESGLRDGRIASLEASVREITEDFKKIKIMIWMLYGAIALVQFLPDVKGFLDATNP